MNNYHFRSLAVVISLVFMSGCVGYVSPYPEYSAPMAAPYAVPPPTYSYRIVPVIPLPLFHFGFYRWGYGGYGHYRHFRHH